MDSELNTQIKKQITYKKKKIENPLLVPEYLLGEHLKIFAHDNSREYYLKGNDIYYNTFVYDI